MAKPGKRGSRSSFGGRPEQQRQLADQARAELNKIRLEWLASIDAITEAKSEIFAAIARRKATCSALSARRVDCIQRLRRAFPEAAESFENDPGFEIEVPNRAIWIQDGIRLVYESDYAKPFPSQDMAIQQGRVHSPGLSDAVWSPSLSSTSPSTAIPEFLSDMGRQITSHYSLLPQIFNSPKQVPNSQTTVSRLLSCITLARI